MNRQELNRVIGTPAARWTLKLVLFLAMGWIAAGTSARAQELTRESLAGSEAGNTTGLGEADQPNYNLKVGPVKVLADTAAGIEYIDNIGYAEHNRISDEVIRFSLNLRTLYQFTRLNKIQFDIGIGFVRYLEHPNATSNNLFITPGSQLAFDIYVADIFRINVHDSFALLQDPVNGGGPPQLSNVTNFARFTNSAGVTLIADFNKLVFTTGYEHYNYWSITSAYDYLNRASDTISGSAAYKLAPRAFVGVEGSYAWTNYDHSQLITQNDSSGGTVDLYLDITPTPYLRLIARGGYQFASFDNTGSFSTGLLANGQTVNTVFGTQGPVSDASSLSDFFWSIQINNRLNAYLTHSVSAGRENDLGLTSNYITVNYARYNIAWRALKKVTLGGDLFYENDQESGGLLNEALQRYGGDVTLGYQFSMQLAATVHYAYIKKDSDIGNRSYYQNRAGVDVDYKF